MLCHIWWKNPEFWSKCREMHYPGTHIGSGYEAPVPRCQGCKPCLSGFEMANVE